MRPPMFRYRSKLCVAGLMLAPLVADVESGGRDSSEFRLTLAGGGGSYAAVSRGCGGGVLVEDLLPFSDVGVSIERASGPAVFGLRGSFIHTSDGPDPVENALLNLYASFEGRRVGIGTGIVATRKGLPRRDDNRVRSPVSAHVRFGNPAKLYLSASVFENLPLYSGGGYLDTGFGGRPHRRLNLWVGVSGGGPYDAGGVLMKSSLTLSRDLDLGLRARFGSSEGVSENAFSIGVTRRFVDRSND